ncbi:hypothetical protein QQX98_005029 [Neonectria punicea]|uniref:Uncharacterized protein n=1 Tax=Neonectria punicea TaxID=979145 RepID=A0ABR1H742_9HYPO
MAGQWKRRFSLSSPAVKASKRVMEQHDQPRHSSVDSNATTTTVGEVPAVEIENYFLSPASRWTTANRLG